MLLESPHEQWLIDGGALLKKIPKRNGFLIVEFSQEVEARNEALICSYVCTLFLLHRPRSQHIESNAVIYAYHLNFTQEQPQ